MGAAMQRTESVQVNDAETLEDGLWRRHTM
jgi:hypothetical protein